jgi:hypothetical protein
VRGIGASGDAEIERVGQRVVGSIVDANLAGFAERGRTGKSEDQMRVGIHAGCLIRRETFNPGRLRQAMPSGQQN